MVTIKVILEFHATNTEWVTECATQVFFLVLEYTFLITFVIHIFVLFIS